MQTIMNYKGQVPYAVEDTLNKLVAAVQDLERVNNDLRATIAAQPPILTLAQIQSGLSANGSNPLNVTGLRGTPTP